MEGYYEFHNCQRIKGKGIELSAYYMRLLVSINIICSHATNLPRKIRTIKQRVRERITVKRSGFLKKFKHRIPGAHGAGYLTGYGTAINGKRIGERGVDVYAEVSVLDAFGFQVKHIVQVVIAVHFYGAIALAECQVFAIVHIEPVHAAVLARHQDAGTVFIHRTAHTFQPAFGSGRCLVELPGIAVIPVQDAKEVGPIVDAIRRPNAEQIEVVRLTAVKKSVAFGGIHVADGAGYNVHIERKTRRDIFAGRVWKSRVKDLYFKPASAFLAIPSRELLTADQLFCHKPGRRLRSQSRGPRHL